MSGNCQVSLKVTKKITNDLNFGWYGPRTSHPHIKNPKYNMLAHTRNLRIGETDLFMVSTSFCELQSLKLKVQKKNF